MSRKPADIAVDLLIVIAILLATTVLPGLLP